MSDKKEEWLRINKNLRDYRSRGRDKVKKKSPRGKKLYKKYMRDILWGESILDVGCGSKTIESYLPPHVKKYVGLDPFPIKDDVVAVPVEECVFKNKSFDTVMALASLDYTYNLEKALEQINRIAKKNVVIVTGLGKLPDKLHTQTIKMVDLKRGLKNFKLKLKKRIFHTAYLLEFRRKK